MSWRGFSCFVVLIFAGLALAAGGGEGKARHAVTGLDGRSLEQRYIDRALEFRANQRNPAAGLKALFQIENKIWGELGPAQRHQVHAEKAACFESLLDAAVAGTLRLAAGKGTGAPEGLTRQLDRLEKMTASAITLRNGGQLRPHESPYLSLTDSLYEAQWLARALRAGASARPFTLADRALLSAEHALANGQHETALRALAPLRNRFGPALDPLQQAVLGQLEVRAYGSLIAAYGQRARAIMRGSEPLSHDHWQVVKQVQTLSDGARQAAAKMMVGNPDLLALKGVIQEGQKWADGLTDALNMKGIWRVPAQPKPPPKPLLKRLIDAL